MTAPQNPQNWPQQPQQPQQPGFDNPQQPGYGPPQPGPPQVGPTQPGPQPGFQQPGPQQPGPQPTGPQPTGFQQPGPQPGQPGGYGQPGAYGPPQPGLQQPGFPPPGPQQPGFGQPGFQQPGYGPPKKSRTGLVVGIVIGVVVLVVGGVLGTFYLSYIDEPGGGPGGEPVAQCELSGELKSQAHVSSFRLLQKPAAEDSGMRHSHCMWGQTKGKDGPNPRVLDLHVYDYAEFSEKNDRNIESAEGSYDGFTSYANGQQAKPVDGLGDEAMMVIPSDAGDLTEVNLLVRKGPVVLNIRYSGRDKGFFTDSAFPVEDAEAVARKTAEELISK